MLGMNSGYGMQEPKALRECKRDIETEIKIVRKRAVLYQGALNTLHALTEIEHFDPNDKFNIFELIGRLVVSIRAEEAQEGRLLVELEREKGGK